MDNIETEEYPKLSLKEFLILEMLVNREGMYGLEMVEASSGELKRGTIYPTLQRMTEKCYIDSKEEPRSHPEIGIPRRIYCLTEFGKRTFNKNINLKRMMSSELLDIEAAANVLYVSVDTFERWIEAGEIKYTVGTSDEVRIAKDDILSDETKSFLDEGMKWEQMRPEEGIAHGEYWFNKAIKSNDKYALAFHELGRMFYSWGHYYRAIEPLQKAFELNSEAMAPSMNLGLTFSGMQRHKEAEKCFRNVVRLNPEFAKGHHELGVSLAFQGFYNKEKAIEAAGVLRHAVNLDSNFHMSAWFLSRLYTLPSYGICDFYTAEKFAEEVKIKFPQLADEISFLISVNQKAAIAS